MTKHEKTAYGRQQEEQMQATDLPFQKCSAQEGIALATRKCSRG